MANEEQRGNRVKRKLKSGKPMPGPHISSPASATENSAQRARNRR